MPTVKCFKIGGLNCIIHTRDEHEPAHFHVIRSGEWEITVNILTTFEGSLDFEVVWPSNEKNIPGKFTRDLIAEVVHHRVELMEEWERAQPND